MSIVQILPVDQDLANLFPARNVQLSKFITLLCLYILANNLDGDFMPPLPLPVPVMT